MILANPQRNPVKFALCFSCHKGGAVSERFSEMHKTPLTQTQRLLLPSATQRLQCGIPVNRWRVGAAYGPHRCRCEQLVMQQSSPCEDSKQQSLLTNHEVPHLLICLFVYFFVLSFIRPKMSSECQACVIQNKSVQSIQAAVVQQCFIQNTSMAGSGYGNWKGTVSPREELVLL